MTPGRFAQSIALIVLLTFVLLVPVRIVAHVGRVSAAAETQPAASEGDAADDAAVWIHPTDPSLSMVIAANKRGGLRGYDLAGDEIQRLLAVDANSVDVRHDFPLGGRRVGLVAVSRLDGSLGVYAVDPARRSLVDVAARPIRPGIESYGVCLHHSVASDRYYVFVTDERGGLEQWELRDDGRGKVKGARVRRLELGAPAEVCVADDLHRFLYVAEEGVGIWRYGADSGDGAERRLVDWTGPGGHLATGVEGLALYQVADGTGYLIASSQGTDSFVVYDRVDPNAYVTTFEIVDGESVDGVSGTDGIEAVSAPLGAAFPDGLFVAHDGANPGGGQNFKLVPWGRLARAATPRLKVGTPLDPRGPEGTKPASAEGADDEASQVVGLRFTDLDIPRNASILSVHVEFAAYERAERAGPMTIRAQAVDDARAIAGTGSGPSLRPLTVAGVEWSPSARRGAPAMGRGELTPNLAPMFQEIVGRPGWRPGNAIVLVFSRKGEGEAFEGGRTEAPLLHIEYRRQPG